MLHAPRSRWAAAATHLVLSVVLIGTIALVAFLQMFPAGLHHAAKLDKLLGIMLGVDIVAGPILTLILYRVGKRGLKFDLAVIAVLQIAFLAYGLSTLWRSRPLFLVGSQQAFALIFANEVPDDAAEQARGNGWTRFHGTGPWLVGVDLSSEMAKEEFLFAYMAGEAGPLRDPDLYLPYADVRADVVAKARALPADLPTSGLDRTRVKSMALISARSRNAIMLLDSGNGDPVRVMALPAAARATSVR